MTHCNLRINDGTVPQGNSIYFFTGKSIMGGMDIEKLKKKLDS